MKMIVFPFLYFYFLSSIVQTGLSDVYVYNSTNKLIEDFDDQPANFGPSLLQEGLKGYVVLANPRHACTKIEFPPNTSSPEYQWIVLISRTNSADMCDFDLKVQNAQNANFSAVIIYNYDDVLITMNGHGRSIKIPSTLITYSDGLTIIKNYLYNQTSKLKTSQFYIRIVPEQPIKFGAYIIPLVCVIGVSIFGLIFFTLIKCYLNRRQMRRHRLPRSALKQLKTKKFVKGDRWDVCAVCLDDFEDGAKLRILPCDHAYHMKCIDPWLTNNRRQCPVCKRYVFPNHDDSDEENTAQTATEQTPLIQPSNDDLTATNSRIRHLEHRLNNPLDTGVPNNGYSINESSEIDDYQDPSSSITQGTINRITTNEIIFDRPVFHSRYHSSPQVPRLLIRQSSSENNDSNNTKSTITTTYGSLQDSSSTIFTTPRAANFAIDSTDDIIDSIHISSQSAIEDASDVETDDNDERMHSVSSDIPTNHSTTTIDDESANTGRKDM